MGEIRIESIDTRFHRSGVFESDMDGERVGDVVRGGVEVGWIPRGCIKPIVNSQSLQAKDRLSWRYTRMIMGC